MISTSLGKPNYKYCGCHLHVDLPLRTGRPARIYLQQTHYGHAIATLRKVGTDEDNKWEIQE
jgi:hypothetical protein